MQLFRRTANVVVPALAAMFLMFGLARLAYADTPDQANRFVIERDNRAIVIEPFGANIVRVTLSSEKAAALATPGYGIVGTPSMGGWTHEQDSAGYDVIRSARLLIRVAPKSLSPPQAMPLDELNRSLRNRYFYGDSDRRTYDDSIFVSNTAGKPLLTMWRWSMAPNGAEAAAGTQRNKRRRTPGTAFPQPSIRPPASITMGLASSNRALSTCATIKSNVGMITQQSAERTSAFRSWSRAAATV